MERRFTKHTSDEFEGTEATGLSKLWEFGSSMLDIERYKRKNGDSLYFNLYFSDPGEGPMSWRGGSIELNIDGEYIKITGEIEKHNYAFGKDYCLTTFISVRQLMNICKANDLKVARSLALFGGPDLRYKFSPDENHRFQSVCRAFMLEEFGEAQFQEATDKFYRMEDVAERRAALRVYYIIFGVISALGIGNLALHQWSPLLFGIALFFQVTAIIGFGLEYIKDKIFGA